MNENLGDKGYIENLLKAMSAAEAINIFTDIEKRIKQLIECSTDDFLTLNDHFKSYHKESKNIAQNASSIIQVFTDSKLNSSFSNIKKFGESFDTLTKIFSQHVEFLDIEIKKTANKFENLKIAHSNYRQILLSLQLLITNLKIDDISSHQNKNSKTDCDEIENKMQIIKKLISETDLLIEQFINLASESYVLLNSIKKQNYDQLQKLNDNIEISFGLFKRKYTEASALFPALKKLTDKNSSNIAKIITNLQYHDIIQQKIEHIQRTHKDIINDLQTFKKDEQNFALLHNKAKTFLKIKDISGLQAAQLIHANRQYQMAIEEIGVNLEAIGNEMIAISSLCENLVGKSTQTKDYYLNNILESLNKALSYNNTLADFINNIKRLTGGLSKKNEEFTYHYSEIHANKESVKNLLQGIFKNLHLSEKSAKESNIVQQITELINEADELEKHIYEIHNELKLKVDHIVNPKENFLAETNILLSLNELSTSIPGLIDMMKVSIQKIDEYLYFNSTISLNISNHIKTSLRKVKYYKLFEKVSEQIIEDLNGINIRLNFGSTPASVRKEDNLKHLKDRYTMASEHLIHDHVSKISDISEISNSDTEKTIIEIANQKSKTDDDNLELF
jgi:hypothetical protein